MVQAPPKRETAPLQLDEEIELRFPADCLLTDELYIQFCLANEHLRFERSAEGSLVIVSFPSIPSTRGESEIGRQVGNWSADEGGQWLNSGAEYRFPDGRIMFADTTWLTQDQWDGLGEAQQGSFVPVPPTFVVEVRSPGQSLASQQRKMERWFGYGARLGWLVDQTSSRLWVYRPGVEPVELQRPLEIDGLPELPGLTVDLSRVWL